MKFGWIPAQTFILAKMTVVTLDDLGLSENEWNEMDQDEKDENMRDVAFETLDWGWKEI
ncbi:hypothetical protein [Escherichia coli]|uniref:DUF7167 family protein n=1 Tax=Escherichia coli TaxID=562 RepID=UPI002AF6C24F|nr:hypothetical protein [Escherichia coli]MEA1173703.1 hypothetical protein [Escherichia coli]